MIRPKSGTEIEGGRPGPAAPFKDARGAESIRAKTFDFVLVARLGAVLIVILAAFGLYFSNRP